MMPKKSYPFQVILSLLFVSLAGTVCSREPIASVPKIKKLAPERAVKEFPVSVKVQVLWVHPTGNGFFVHSEGAGIYVHKPLAGGALARFSVGDIIRVKGKTNKGFFSPSIFAEEVELLGKEPLPEPRPFYDFEKYSTSIDCDWVWLAGRILSKRVYLGDGGDSIGLEVEHNNDLVDIQMPWSKENEEQIDELMFSRVRFNAVAGTQFNLNRQVVGRTFFVNSTEDFEVVDDYQPDGGISVKPIHELLRCGDAHPRMPAATYGLVTHVEGNHLYLRDEEACMKATVREAPDVVVGDFVELEGFVLPRPISPEFVAKELRVVEHRGAPEPITMFLNEELRERWDFNPDSSLNHELVQVDAQLVDVSISFGLTSGYRERTLLCRQGAHLFEAKIPAHVDLGKELKPGAVLRLKGICNLTRSEERRWRLYVDGFWIQMRDVNDIEILIPAPWWTTARLLWLLGAALGLAALFVIWVGLLRKQVDKQTGVIGKQIERESVSEERQRIARELHDNLEQGLAGMAIQLRGSQRILELNREKRLGSIRALQEMFGAENMRLKQHLEHAELEVVEDAERNREAIQIVQGMLVHCSHESRTSIMDLRGGILERLDFVDALEESLQPMAQACGAELEIKVEGQIRKLKQAAERNLLLIIKEAVTNASKHAEPDEIDVVLNYTKSGLIFRIIDDGKGFDANSLSKAGHFGLQGMRERINQLKGTLEIESRPETGTCVNIAITSTVELEQE